MKSRALDVAESYGSGLPRFSNLREARRALFAERDRGLAHLASIAPGVADLALDLTPESLRGLERWYFRLHRAQGWRRAGTDRKAFEDAMAYYVGAVARRSVPGARWIVEGYAFTSGRYEIGIAKGLHKVMLGGMCGDWYKMPRNAKQNALYRRYRDWWPPRRPPSRPARPAGDAAIAREIERLLRLKSHPSIYPGQLVSFVRHGLHDDRIAALRIQRVVKSMLAKGVLEKVPLVRKAGFRYRLAP